MQEKMLKFSTIIGSLFYLFSLSSCSIPNSVKHSPVNILIIEEARKYIGTAYKTAGKTPKGFDCSGYTSYIFNQFDIELSSSSALQALNGKNVPLTAAKIGDLVFFSKTDSNKEIMHVGIVSKKNEEGFFMLHSSSSKGVIESNISKSSYWKSRLLYLRRVL